jgi:predicted secreted protein
MTVTTALAIYFLIWWVTLFAVLPWGVRSQHEGGQGSGGIVPGTDPGAPTTFRLGRKLLWTTLVAGAVYAVGAVIYVEHWVTLERLMPPFARHNIQLYQ